MPKLNLDVRPESGRNNKSFEALSKEPQTPDQFFPSAPRSLTDTEFAKLIIRSQNRIPEMAMLFVAAFYGDNCPKRIKAIGAAGILADFVPAFEIASTVLQDERWYGNRSVAEQALCNLSELDKELKKSRVLIDPRHHALARMACFFQDLGKANVLGRVDFDSGYRSVVFPDHEAASAHIFCEAMKLVDYCLPHTAPHDLNFSGGEKALVQQIILRSGRVLQLAQNPDPISNRVLERLFRDLLSEPILAEKISLEVVINSFLAVEKSSMRAENPHHRTDGREFWNQVTFQWNREIAAMARIAAELERPILEVIHHEIEEQSTVSLITHSDWEWLGIDEGNRNRICTQLKQQAKAGKSITHIEALRTACALSGFEIDPAALARIAEDPLSASKVLHVPNTDSGPILSRVLHTNARPLRQIEADDSLDGLRAHLRTDNYPRINDWMMNKGVSRAELKELLISKGFGNLILFEQFLTNQTVDPRDVFRYECQSSGVFTIYAVWPDGYSRITRLAGGFQSKAARVGSGMFHMVQRRFCEITEGFQVDGKDADVTVRDPDAIVKRFIDGLQGIAANERLEIPSGIDPTRRRLIPGRILDSDYYATLVVDVVTRPWSCVTAYFHRDASKYRNEIKRLLRSYHGAYMKLPSKKQDDLQNFPPVTALVEPVNEQLLRFGMKPITSDNFEFLQQIRGAVNRR